MPGFSRSLLAAAVWTGATCGAPEPPPPAAPPVVLPAMSVPPPRARLESAPEHLAFGADTLRLDPYLWQDFMPPVLHTDGAGRAGALVMGKIALTGAAPGVRVVRAWLLMDDEVGGMTVFPGAPPSALSVRAYRPLGSVPVQVVVQVRDARGRFHFLRTGPWRVEVAM